MHYYAFLNRTILYYYTCVPVAKVCKKICQNWYNPIKTQLVKICFNYIHLPSKLVYINVSRETLGHRFSHIAVKQHLQLGQNNKIIKQPLQFALCILSLVIRLLHLKI